MIYSRRRLLAQVFGCGVVGALLGPVARARAGTMSYEYDALGRLKKVIYPDSSAVQYGYDAVGNRVQKGPPGGGFTATIQVTGSVPVDLRSLANSNGYDGAQSANITFEVGNGVTITGTAGLGGSNSGDPGSAGGIAIDTGTWPGGYTHNLSLVVKSGGAVRGGGGGGGAGGHGDSLNPGYGGVGGAGGDAVYVRTPMSVTVQSSGEIKGGGAGGAGGYGDSIWEDVPPDYCTNYDGGGGGGGYPNGGEGGGYNPGSPGDPSGGGGGGSGTDPSYSTDGANGGGAGGGYAIRKNGHTVSVSNSGTLIGAAT